MPTTYAIAAAAAALAMSAHVAAAFAPASLPSAPRTVLHVNHERETTEWPRAAPCLTETALRRSVDECLAADGEWKKNVALIGSTGSIGTQTLDIVRARPDRFSVVSLAAGSNVELLAQQAAEFKETVKVVSIGDTSKVGALKTRLDELGVKGMDVVAGAEGPTAAATLDEADVVVTGIVGCAGLLPTVEAIKKGKNIALANKETLISGAPCVCRSAAPRRAAPPLTHTHGPVPPTQLHHPPPREVRRHHDPGRLGALGHLPVPAGRAAGRDAQGHPDGQRRSVP